MKAVTNFVSSVMEEKGLTKKDLVRLMGYKNKEKGECRLTLFLRDKYNNPDFIANVLNALGVDNRTSELAIQATNSDNELEYENYLLKAELIFQEKFCPFIVRETESERPSSITMAALTGGMHKYIPLAKNFKLLAYEDQLKKVSEIIIKDYKKNEGMAGFFGKITGYSYFEQFNNTVLFDVSGNILKENIKKHLPYYSPYGGGYLRLRGKPLPLVFKTN
ncbi:MAG: hypothetical protein AB9882_08685 [Ignavibacteriaceae bacterium]